MKNFKNTIQIKPKIMWPFSTRKLTEEPKQDDWVERHKKRSREYSVSHKDGTRVAAENKDGVWKEGKIIGEHDWELFIFFFTVKFDDGEIIKQEAQKITKL